MISVFGSSVGSEELNEVRLAFKAQWLGLGPKTQEFEAALARRLGQAEFALLDSGSNSLFLAMKLLDLPPGSEVVLPSFTWLACAHAVLLARCVPVFCDVDRETQNVTAETIRPHLSSRTGAIMIVHYAGKPVHMAPITDLGLPVIEDAAHAIDSKLDGRYCGTIGTIGVYSFDAVKNLAMGEGGGLTAHDPELVRRARALRNCGIGASGFESSASRNHWWEYEVEDILPKFLPSDVAAAIGLGQLRKLDQLQRRRREIWDIYQSEFAALDWLVRPQDAGPGEQHSYFTYFVRVGNGRRDALAAHLYRRGIYTTLRYHPLHLNRIYHSSARLPAAERLNEEGLNLPLHPGLSRAQVRRIVTEIKAFGRQLE